MYDMMKQIAEVDRKLDKKRWKGIIPLIVQSY